jgi:hypothetical protein
MNQDFSAIKTEGALLTRGLLDRLYQEDATLPGVDAKSFHLAKQGELREEISRAWNRSLEQWRTFCDLRGDLPETDQGTTLTRERWLLPLFRFLDYGRLPTSPRLEFEGKSYPVSHLYRDRFPIHLISFRRDLDKRVPGVTRTSPQAMVQELLNRSDDYLWACFSNGLTMRLLRDNVSLSRMAYVEFDLEAMFEGESFADFRLLYLMLHQSRVEQDDNNDLLLEVWAHEAHETGTRALEHLREGVEQTLNTLGQGFLAHPANEELRQALREGDLTREAYYHELLRLVYRFIFLFVAEDRQMLHADSVPDDARQRYYANYSLSRIRVLADKRLGSPTAGDLWECLKLTFTSVHDGQELFGLTGLGGTLFAEETTRCTAHAQLANEGLLNAMRALAFTEENRVRVAVDFRNLGSEELGSVYESLLELHPYVHTEGAEFRLEAVAGSERKVTGSYYTPTELIECLLDTSLDPVVEKARRSKDPERAILDLKVCDPACGSGHFLVGAAHRMAQALATVRSGEDEATPNDHRQALRDVISHCIYGVDLNPLAVELCRVALWMESLVPGKPLNFLTSHIKCGNSLVGATPELIAGGIPDGAYKPRTGDDKAFASEYRKQNKGERKDAKGLYQQSLFDKDGPWNHLGDLARHVAKVEAIEDDSLEHRQEKERRYTELIQSTGYLSGHLLADMWCSAFFWPLVESDKLPYPPTSARIWRVDRQPHDCPPWLRDEVQRLAAERLFFHWHLEFPEVFNEDRQGFDCMLGNPPWEQVVLIEKEFFASRAPVIADAPTTAARSKLINALGKADPLADPDRLKLWHEYVAAKHGKESETIFMKESGRYQFLSGKLNTYQAFVALFRQILGKGGRLGIIVPSGIATDNSNKELFSELVETESLVSLYDFENRDGIFPGVHRSFKFCLLSVGALGAGREGADFAFFLTNPRQLAERIRHFELTREDIVLLNPNTKTCPIFRSKLDAELTKYIYRRVPVLIDETKPGGNPWGITFKQGLFNMSSDSHLFCTAEELRADGWELGGNVFHKDDAKYLPLYEAKMFHHFNHRFGSYEDVPENSSTVQLPDTRLERLQNPDYSARPRYWVPEAEVAGRLAPYGNPSWLCAFRDICRSTDERTAIFAIIPAVGVGHTAPLVFAQGSRCLLASALCSFAADFVGRQSVGGTHLTYSYLRQFAVHPPEHYERPCPWLAENTVGQWVTARSLELVATGSDVNAVLVEGGIGRASFGWNEKRRLLIRCELDAAFFHLYLGAPDEWKEKGNPELLEYFPTPRHAVDYIMDTFPIVKRKDEAKHGDYRTKLQILQVYDAMAEAITTGNPYQTILDPPPGPPADADGNFIPVADWHTLDPHRTSHIHPPR